MSPKVKDRAIKLLIEYLNTNGKDSFGYFISKDVLIRRSVVQVVVNDLIDDIRRSDDSLDSVLNNYIIKMGKMATQVRNPELFYEARDVAEDIEEMLHIYEYLY